MSVTIISVGKNKDSEILSLENSYLKRLKTLKVKVKEVKAFSENPEKEAQEVLKKLQEFKSSYQIYLLNENGEQYSSKAFSKSVFSHIQKSQDVIFVVAGAQGHGPSMQQAIHRNFSLGKMTFPHKIARLLLIEQLYRAETIYHGHPYHNQ